MCLLVMPYTSSIAQNRLAVHKLSLDLMCIYYSVDRYDDYPTQR